MLEMFKGLFIEEEGQGMTEYGLILGLIAVVVIGALGFLGGSINDLFNGLKDKIPTVGGDV
ncbi:pilus assembly protein [Thalassobacillus devorans]|uniref:Pilus assembly protein n=1 Tax=Thalassobacillus devorans TaxID=279813 RepID=A0ABQ1PNT4_9BACI|nr:Flp family type IVb pilin [Thalassobacillus devorans]NIK30457.1 pilus assembly protein Flp/PilA [Thalassobacillus devorans]GGD00141.1 pilus assembly protein [Thalassobacillus devorans]